MKNRKILMTFNPKSNWVEKYTYFMGSHYLSFEMKLEELLNDLGIKYQ